MVIAGDDGTEITTPDGDTIILNKDQSVWISDGGEAKVRQLLLYSLLLVA